MTGRDRRLSVLAHLAAFGPVIVLGLLAGGPRGWISAFIPLGPLLLGLLPVARLGAVAEHRRDALTFSVAIAVYLFVAWGALYLAAGTTIAGFVIPPALLVLMIIALNWIIFAIIAARRAAAGERLDYPLVPRALRRLLAPQHPEGVTHGNG